MARIPYNNALGTLGADLTDVGTTITFASAPSFATLASGDYIPLVLEPPAGSPSANFEIIYLTAYTATDTTGTIRRGQEDTSGVAHSNGSAWACSPVVEDVTLNLPFVVSSLAVDANYIYWGDMSRTTLEPYIARANLDGSGVNLEFLDTGGPVGAPNAAAAIAVDSTYIYWANESTGNIGRANLDGSGVNTSFITGPGGPQGVAVNSSFIYWTDNPGGAGKIGRANIDGSSVNTAFMDVSAGGSGAYGVAVDATYIYWTDDVNQEVGRALLNGSSITQGFIENGFYGICVTGSYLFFQDNSGMRAALDGSGATNILPSTVAVTFGTAIAANSTYVYWSFKSGFTFPMVRSAVDLSTHDFAYLPARLG